MKRAIAAIAACAALLSACGGEEEAPAAAPTTTSTTAEIPDDVVGVELDVSQAGGYDISDVGGEATISYRFEDSAYLRNSLERSLVERHPEDRYVGCGALLVTIKGPGASDQIQRAVERKLDELYAC